ncbi:MmgE/PrpD family protein [Lutispora sp.]|uniref:MmgE/PrpD family protein n=1 Tax=Lutispora sp. TaxID=2828727 RepID=UPI003565FB88
MKENITDLFIDDLYNMAQGEFSELVIKQAKKCVLDYFGVTLAGARMIEEKGEKYLNFFSSKHGDTTVIGLNRKANIQDAVLINGLSAHVAELDDGHRFGMLHLGAPIISALIALAEKEKLDGKDFLSGVVIGYEAAVRLASAIQPFHKQRGYHASGTCGTIGVAMGVSAALGFTKSQMKDALSASATCASGILETIEDGSELKPFNIGRAALDGLIAAFMARAGFAGPEDVLGGKRGFLPVMAEKFDLNSIYYKNGDALAIEKIYLKPYAACRHCHPAIEAAINLLSKYGIQAKDIRDVKVSTYKLAVGGHDHTLIQGINSAKMSIPYSVAAALKFGKAGIDEFMEQHHEDKDITYLLEKIKVCVDDELSALVPHKRSAVVEITLDNNKHYMERVDYPRGEPENPLSDEELEDKFISLAKYGGKSGDDITAIIRSVWNIENDLSELVKLI